VLTAHYAAEHLQRFDLNRPPLLRCTAHLLSEDTFEFGWTEHHVIGDGWSINSLIAELFGGSRSEARRKLAQGGVRVDGEPWPAQVLDVAADDLEGRVLQVGKRQFRRLVRT